MMMVLEASRQVRIEVTACWGLKVQAAVSELTIPASGSVFVLELKPAVVVAEAERFAAPVAQASKAVGLEVAAFWAADSAEPLAPNVRAIKQKK